MTGTLTDDGERAMRMKNVNDVDLLDSASLKFGQLSTVAHADNQAMYDKLT